jgi:hypothetical protein
MMGIFSNLNIDKTTENNKLFVLHLKLIYLNHHIQHFYVHFT